MNWIWSRSRLPTVAFFLAACGHQPIEVSTQHLQQATSIKDNSPIPEIVRYSSWLPSPQIIKSDPTFNVVVNRVPVEEVLFTLAQDAKLNLDIHPEVQGLVTLNAIQQTIPQLLHRISKQTNIRYQWEQNNLAVLPDTPYLQHYRVDYVNITRDAESSMINSMQVNNQSPGTNTQGNHSSIAIRDSSKNRFWETLIQNSRDILRETNLSPDTSQISDSAINKTEAGIAPVGNTVNRTSVIANPENGLLSIVATQQQHLKIQDFLSQVMNSARRQVLIEITIVEVRLSDQYQQGINWSALIQANGKDFKVTQSGNTNLGNGMLGVLSSNNITQQLALLSSFGKVKVLSSPKLSVLNNQTAMMRVVDNLVYFSVKADTVSNQNSASVTTYTTTPNTVPVGFTMSLTPQISDNNIVLLNLKPSISRLIQYVPDPNPNLLNIRYLGVPEIQTREMESLMRLENNQIAVMGGLMQDRSSQFSHQVPGLGNIPIAGELFKQRNDHQETTELVIFLRPVVIQTASIEGDYRGFGKRLPDADFFRPHEQL